MAFSYENWKKQNNSKRKGTNTGVPSFEEFKSSRTPSKVETKTDDYLPSMEAFRYDQTKKSDKARQADADRFARGHKSEAPKSEKAKKADADRFAGKYLSQEAKRVEKARQADADRFAKKYTTEQARLNHEALKSKSTISRPTDVPKLGQKEKQPTKKSDNASILSKILGSINDKDSYLNSSGVQINPLGNSLHNIGGKAESDTYKDTAKGFFMKDNVNDRLPEKAGANLRLGIGDTIESVAGGIRWITDKKSPLPNQKNFLADGVQSLADKTRKGFEDSAFQKEFEVSDWKNPEWLATQLPRAIPQLLTSIIPGMGAAAATGKLSAVAKLSKLQRTIVQSIGGAGVTTAIDSTLEAGGVYDEALRRGMSQEKADSAAHETFNKNFLLTGGTTFGEFMLGLSPLGRKFNQINKVGQIGLRAGGGAVLEGLQEGAQEGISADALGDEFNWTDPSTIEAMLLGGILGGTVTGSMATYGEVKKALTKTPQMDSPLTDILNRAIEDMPEELRADLDRSAANFRERQAELTEDESRQMAVEQLLQDVPEFQSVIEDATKGYVADKKQEAQATELNPLTQEQNNLEEAQLEEMQSSTIEPTIDNTPSISPLDGQTSNAIQETIPEVQPLAHNDVQTLPKVEPGTNIPKNETGLKTPLKVEIGDKVNLEGTRSGSEYLVEGVEGDSVNVLTPNKVSIKVPKSKILSVFNRKSFEEAEANAESFEGEEFETYSNEELPPGEMVGNTQLPPNFRKDVQEILGEFVNDEGMTINEAVDMVKSDEYYADNTEWKRLIDEEATKHFGYKPSGITKVTKEVGNAIEFIEDSVNQMKSMEFVSEDDKAMYFKGEYGFDNVTKEDVKIQKSDGLIYTRTIGEKEWINSYVKYPPFQKEEKVTEKENKINFTIDQFEPRGMQEGLYSTGSDSGTLTATIFQSAEQDVLDALEREGFQYSKTNTVGPGKGRHFVFKRKGGVEELKRINKVLAPFKERYSENGNRIKAEREETKKDVSFGDKFNVGDIVYHATKGGSASEFKVTSKENNQYTLQSTTSKYKFFSPFGLPKSDQHLYSDEAEAEKVAKELRKQMDKEHEEYTTGWKRAPENDISNVDRHIRHLPLDVIDERRPLPKITFKETDTRITATFVPNKGPWDNADPKKLTLMFPKDKNGYLRLPKAKSVADINDLMNIDFAQEGVTAKQLIATFEYMNGTHSSEPKKAPVKKEDEQYVYIDDSRLKHPKLYKTEELQDIVENLSFDASGFDSQKTFNKYIKMLEKEWNNRLDEEEAQAKKPIAQPKQEPKPPENVKAEEPNKFDKMRDRLEFTEKAAAAARKRLAERKGRLLSGLPMDDMVDYTIIGMDKLAHKMVDMAEFTDSMVKEFGESIRIWIPAIYAQSVAALDYNEEQLNEMLQGAYGDEDIKVVAEEVEQVEEAKSPFDHRAIEEEIRKKFKFDPYDNESIINLMNTGIGKYNYKDENHVQQRYRNEETILSLMSDDEVKDYVAWNQIRQKWWSERFKERAALKKEFMSHILTSGFGSLHWISGGRASGDRFNKKQYELVIGHKDNERIIYPSFNEMWGRFEKLLNVYEGDTSNEVETNSDRPLETSGTGKIPGTTENGETTQGSGSSKRGNDGSGSIDLPGTRQSEPSTKSEKSPGSNQAPEHDLETSRGNESPQSIRKPGRINFKIDDDLDKLGKVKERYKGNIKALRLLKGLQDEGRLASAEEQKVLSRYVGWGALAPAFDNANKNWKKEYAELLSLVEDGTITQEEYEHARKTTQYAHYTSKEVIQSMFKAVENMGVKGGRILEPGMGIGNFFGLLPNNWNADLTGVEFDSLTGNVAKQLYQKANIEVKPYQDFKIADGYFDLAIGNPPYSSKTSEYQGDKLTLHNYFFMKSLDKLRPGGILAFVTSAGTMNSKTTSPRKKMGEKADFLGAIRLPSEAFKANAGTEVTTDIIFFQKREEGAKPNHRGNFINALDRSVVDRDGKTVVVKENEYFQQNPDMVLGDIVVDKLIANRGTPRLGVVSKFNFSEQFAEAIEKLPKNIYQETSEKVKKVDIVEEVTTNLSGLDEGNFAFENGQLVQLSQGRVIRRADLKGEKIERIKGLVKIRDAAKQTLKVQLETDDDTKIKAAIQKLNFLYDGFVKKYKTINSTTNHRPNITAMKEDPVGLSLLQSLEKEENGKYVKQDVFKERVISFIPSIKNVTTSEEAMMVSLSQKGRIDLPYMKEISNIEEETIIKQLGSRIYNNPSTGWEIEDGYLSGNVRRKLEEARAAVDTDPSFQRNIKALEAIVPEDIESDSIAVQFGSPWIPEQDYTDFLNSFFQARGNGVRVRFIRQTGDWKIEGKLDTAINTSEHAIASERRGGQRLTGTDLIETAMNSKTPVVKYKDEFNNLLVDSEATAAARLKTTELQDEFQDWLFSDNQREQRLVRKYNDEFNSVVLRDYDGSLVYGGELADNKPIAGGFNNVKYELRKHQKDVVWRMVQGGNALLAHVVGAGKTLEMIVGGMEMKRLGLIQKPLYIVPNNLFDQWGRDFRDSYPNANILMLSNDLIPSIGITKNFEKKRLTASVDLTQLSKSDRVSLKGNAKKYKVEVDKGAEVVVRDSKGNLTSVRRKDIETLHTQESEKAFEGRLNEQRANRGAALNRIAVGNYDAIILTHETFKKLPMSPEYTREFIREQLIDLEFALQAMNDEASGNNKRTIKQLENAKERLEEQLEALIDEDGKDIAVPFEMLGVDQIFVDEAHKFKNLKFHTKLTGITGLSNTASKRSEDLYMKTKWLTKMRNGRGVVFATGTPISNTLAEMFTMQRYLQNERLDELNIRHFDMWTKMFGLTEVGVEMDVAGGFKQRTRFKKFRNLPELMTMFNEVTDIKTAPMLNLPRPKNVNFETVIAPISNQQKAYMQNIVSRARDVQSGMVDKSEDNWLKITGDARKMSLDIRLAEPSADEDTESKINVAVDNIVQIWKDGTKSRPDKEGKPVDNLTQLVFADLGTPKAKKQNADGDDMDSDTDEVLSFDIYTDMRGKLEKQGIPKEHMVFIHEAKTPKQKEKLFKDVKSGKVRILFGSTEKMGAGMNVQDRLVALHHIDAPWRPSDVEQREGRMIRQGNRLEDVTVYQYVTEGSFDRIMWDLLKNKAGFIEQVMNRDGSIREMEDVGAMELRFAHISAASTGDMTVIDKMKIDSEVKDLRNAKESHRKTIRKRKRTLAQLPDQIASITDVLKGVQKDISNIPNKEGDMYPLEFDGKTYETRVEATDALENSYKKAWAKMKNDDRISFGKIGKFELLFMRKLNHFDGQAEPKVVIKGNQEYVVNYNKVSASGSLTRIENVFDKIQAQEIALKEQITKHNDELSSLSKTQHAPFKYEKDLDAALQKQAELEKKMLAMNNDANERITEDDGGNEDTFVDSRTSSSNSNRENETDAESSEKAATRPQIMRYIKDNFNVVIDYKKTRGKKGLYKNKFAIIRVKNYGDFEVLAHELGHRIDTKLKLSINKTINNELAKIAESNLEIPKSFNKIQKAREGAAEVFRQYLYGTQDFDNLTEEERDSAWTLDQMSEELSAAIREGLQTQGWDEKTVELQRLIRSWVERTPQQEMAGVTSPFGENHKQKESAKRTWLRLYKWALDKDAPILAAQKLVEKDNGNKKLMDDQNAYGLAVGTRGSTARAVQFLEFGTFITEFVRTNGVFVKTGEPLMDIFEDVEKIGDVDEFGQYLVAKHLYDLKTNKGKVNSPITISEETEMYLKEGDEKYGALAERIYTFQNRMLEDILGANNMVSQELIDKLKEEYKYYVPLSRVKTDTGEKGGIVTSGASSGNSFANTQQGIKRMSKYGSSAMIINPMETIMKNVHLFMGIADKNAVGVAMASWADPDGEFATESTGQVIEKIPHDTSVTKVALSQMTDALLNAGLDSEIMESLDLDQFQNFYTSLFKPNNAKNEVLVWIDGKPNMYKIHDKIVYDSLIDAESPMLSAFLSSPLAQIFTKPVDMVKYGITMTPFFTVQIFVRSYMQLMWKTEAKGKNQLKYGTQVVKSMRDYTKKNEKFMEWMGSGAAQSTFISSQQKYLQRSLDKVKLNKKAQHLFKRKPQSAKETKELVAYISKKYLGYLPQKLQNFNDMLDSSLKMAEYEVMKKQTGNKLEAMKASREADMDYMRSGGAFMKGWNKLDPFNNIAWQGLDAMTRSFAAHPMRQGLRGLILFGIPTFLLALMNYENEEYWELNSYERDLNWQIPMGDGTFFRLRIPFEVGIVFKTIPEKLIFEAFDLFSKQDKNNWDDFSKNIRNTILPAMVPFLFNLGFKYAFEKDWTNGREFVPMEYQGNSPEMQYNEDTSEIGKWLGGILDKSPFVIDETIKGLGAAWGSFILSTTDQTLDATGIVDRPNVKGLRRTYTEKYFTSSINDGSTDSLTTFYKKKQELETAYEDSGVKFDVPPELKAYRQANEDLKDLRKLRKELTWNKLSKADGSSFTQAEKKEQIDTINKGLRDIARMVQGEKPIDPEELNKAWEMVDDYTLYMNQQNKELRKAAKEKNK